MKESIDFKNLKDIHKINRRPKDILVDGKSIFEYPKTPTQIELIKKATQLVSHHLKKLGIEHTSFDEKRIVFLPQSSGYSGADYIVIDKLLGVNLITIVHELIHAQSAEWRNCDEDNLESFLEKNKNKALLSKSGFAHHTMFGDNGNFDFINESITEKITYEIIRNDLNPKENITGIDFFHFEIELINILIEGIAKHNLKTANNPNANEERGRVWEDMQKAYFKNKTFYLRKIEKVFGKGFLRKIDNLNQFFYRGEEQVAFLKEIKNIVDNM